MQKKSRFLTGLLSAVMALTLFALPATAAQTENASVPATIDMTRRGTITINKYEGKEGDTSKPMNDVEFTIYKVADVVQTTEASIDVKMVPVKALTDAATKLHTTINITGQTTYKDIETIVTEALAAEGDAALKAVATAKTHTITDGDGKSKDGVAQFSNLEVGVYLVKETKAPPQVAHLSANFLVSIPMVSADGKSWNYNIEANPKNAAYYGGITLTKYGKEGSKNETALSGASFVLQQYDATASKWNTLTSKDNAKLTADGILTTSTASTSLGQIHVDDLQPGKYRFIEVSAPDGSGYIVDGETAYEFEVKVAVDGTITYAIDSAYKDGDNDAIKVVNEKPDLTKTVFDAKNKSYAKDADFSVGDKVTWKVEATVPSKVDKLDKFELVDQMSKALDLNTQPAEIKVVANKETVTLEKNSDYTVDVVEAAGEQGPKWTIAFTQSGKKKLADNKVEKITVEFDTILNNKAVISTAGNLNKAQLNYTNAFYPSSTDKPDYPNHPDPKTNVVKDEAIVYTFGMSINKVDGKTNTALQGAKFDLYKWTAAEVPDDVKEADLKNAGNATKVRTGLKSDSNGKVVDESGKPLYFSNGDYFLVETEAPVDKDKNPYNLLKEPVKVKLNVVYTTTTQTTYPGETNTDESVTVKATTVTNTTFSEKNNKDEGIVTITVKNNKGFDLPRTGGFGTLLFSGIGALLVVGGIGVLMGTKKKKDNA